MKWWWLRPLSRARRWLERWYGTDGNRKPARSLDRRLERDIADVQREIGYTFARPDLLAVALTHPSAAPGTDQHYERLEFLGDAVLDLAIADMLMRHFPDAKEGPLSKERAAIVNGRALALKARQIELGRKLKLGKGEEKSGGREKTSILAAAFEAVIGATYTDGGLTAAQGVVGRLFSNDIGAPTNERDYKTELQEMANRRFHAHPVYEVVDERGPSHAKSFTTRIRIGGLYLGTGEGASKKQSEQAAAREALDKIQSDPKRAP